jgi:acyl-CoA thioesterase FadM
VLEFRIEERGTGRLVAEAKKVLVRYDFPNEKVVPLEDDLKARLRAQDPDVRQE